MAKKSPPLPETYFDSRTGNYWLRLNTGRFLELSGRDVKLHLMAAGIYIDPENDFGLKAGDAFLVKLQKEKFVDYAGPLAGRRCGFFTSTSGKRVLVTSEALPVQPKRVSADRIDTYLSELLPDGQATFFLYWLKVAYEGLEQGRFLPGQLIALCGPPGCGKSFLHLLITRVLGGRCGKPYRYMTGQTHFNSDLAGSEHLYIEDENARANIAARREFGTAIKDWTVNEEISVHAKGREAITLSFFRRLSLSVNDEPENLMILPPMDTSILDKVMLFKCSPARLEERREKNIAMLDAELPGLVYHLKKMSVPRDYRDPRFGVKAYHHPEILEVLAELSPESRLESLIEEVLFKKGGEDFRGTAEELERELRKGEFAFAIDRLLAFSSAMGTYLARLAHRKPERYEKRKNRGRTIWLIKKGTE